MRKNIQVAFDLGRLACSRVLGWQNKGITRAVHTLFTGLQSYSEPLRVIPVVFGRQNLDYLNGLEKAVKNLEKEFCTPIQALWRKRKNAAFLMQVMAGFLRFVPVSGPIRKNLKHQVGRIYERLYERNGWDSSGKWDIYHSPFDILPSLSLTGILPRILTVYDCLPLVGSDLVTPQNPWGREVLDSLHVDTDYVICISECTRRDVLSFTSIVKDRTCVIPLAADPLFSTPGISRARTVLESMAVTPGKYVLALAQTEPRKNLGRLKRVFARLMANPAFSDYVLLLVLSSGNREQFIKQMGKEFLEKPFVKTITDVDDELLSGLYANAGLFAYLSLYEGFGIPVLEAMSAGCPVVVSDTSSLPEVAGDAGFYVNPLDEEQMVHGITRVLQEKTLRTSLIEKGKLQAGKSSWRSSVEKTAEFYVHVAEKRQRL